MMALRHDQVQNEPALDSNRNAHESHVQSSLRTYTPGCELRWSLSEACPTVSFFQEVSRHPTCFDTQLAALKALL